MTHQGWLVPLTMNTVPWGTSHLAFCGHHPSWVSSGSRLVSLLSLCGCRSGKRAYFETHLWFVSSIFVFLFVKFLLDLSPSWALTCVRKHKLPLMTPGRESDVSPWSGNPGLQGPNTSVEQSFNLGKEDS